MLKVPCTYVEPHTRAVDAHSSRPFTTTDPTFQGLKTTSKEFNSLPPDSFRHNSCLFDPGQPESTASTSVSTSPEARRSMAR